MGVVSVKSVKSGEFGAKRNPRVVIKLSGEALATEQGASSLSSVSNLCDQQLSFVVDQLIRAAQTGVQIGIVVGGGNFMRGATAKSNLIRRDTADQIGMLATLMNAIALADVFLAKGHIAKIYSAFEVPALATRFSARAAEADLSKGHITIYAGGTGNPFCTTDSAAVLRAIETQADLVIKATKVDGIYNKDPKKYSDAVRYDQLTYAEALEKKLEVMDLSAFILCQTFKLPIRVIDLYQPDAIYLALTGEVLGTLVN